MHRLMQAVARSSLPLAAAGAALALLASCGPTEAVRDQADVERLRMRITKVRYAISETRSVIAQSRGAPYEGELWMRLAELQSEEAQYHYMVVQAREQSEGAVHAPQVRFLKEEAIAIYNRILREDPETELGDRILFNIAHEYRELGDFDEMIAALNRLLENERYRGSRYRNEALLVLGDYYFDRNEMEPAERYYRQILESEQGPLHGLAEYKLAWVLVNNGDCRGALSHFETSIDLARSWAERQEREARQAALEELEAERAGIAIAAPDRREEESSAGHQTVDVRREALVDLIYCYSTERPAKNIIPFLREKAFDRGAYIAALEKAATRYGVMEETRGGADVARELLRLAPDDEDRLEDARMLHAAVTRSGDFSHAGSDVHLILRAMRRRATRTGLATKSRARLIGEFEVLARDLSTKAQDQAVKAESREKAQQAAEAYRAYLLSLPSSEHRKAMTANLADTLLLAEEWLEAGRRFRELATLASDDEERGEALYEAVVAYQKSLESDRPRGHLERVEARAGLRKAGLVFLGGEKVAPDKALKIRFAVAQTYYDEGRYRKAIDLLTAVAFEFPDSPEASGAINLVLDSYNTLNDYDGLIAAGRMFLGDGSPASESLRAQIRPIVEAAEQRRLDELSLDASGDTAAGDSRLTAFAKRYQGTDLGERALLSAFVAARAAGEIDRMYELADQISGEYARSEELPGVLSTVGRTAAARFEFEKALQYYDRAAQANPDERGALMLASAQLREQLADFDGAARAYRAALEAAGDDQATRRDAVVGLADLLERQGSAGQAITALVPLAATGDPEVLSRLGLAELRAGRRDQAQQHLEEAISAGASDAAGARAEYGVAELTLQALRDFRPDPSIEGVQELIDLVDQVESMYLGVIRQGDSIYTFAAFARVATAYDIAAEKMGSIRVSGLSGDEAAQVQAVLEQRAEQLRRQRDEALGACAERAAQIHRYDPPARACLGGHPPADDPATLEALRPRHAATLRGVDDIRARLAANPDDLESLVALGTQYLQAGDFHAARLILARATEAGGGPEVLNMLGLASAQAGDISGAMESFSRAAEGGLDAGNINLAAMLAEAGLSSLAQEVRARARSTPTPDQLLPSARGGARR